MEDIEFDTNFDLEDMKKCRQIILSAHGMGSSKDGKTQTKLKEVMKKQGVGVVSFNLLGRGAELFQTEDYIKQFETIEEWARLNFPNSDISLFGSSFGGFLMLQYFAKDPDKYSVLILRAPAIDLASVVKTEIEKQGIFLNEWVTGDGPLESYKPFSLELCSDYANNTTFDTGRNSKINIIAGENDDMVDIKNYQKLLDGGAHIYTINGAGHQLTSPEDLDMFGHYSSLIMEGAKIKWQ
jgi:pimeloyl-ACP methyl ester carboxylesterase